MTIIDMHETLYSIHLFAAAIATKVGHASLYMAPTCVQAEYRVNVNKR
jgi:hypothetical protein